MVKIGIVHATLLYASRMICIDKRYIGFYAVLLQQHPQKICFIFAITKTVLQYTVYRLWLQSANPELKAHITNIISHPKPKIIDDLILKLSCNLSKAS